MEFKVATDLPIGDVVNAHEVSNINAYEASNISVSDLTLTSGFCTSTTLGGFTTINDPTYDPCDLVGHQVDRWAEYLDGQCVGFCEVCTKRVASSRMPGGLPFMRLKALIEQLIASPGDPALLLEISDVEDLLDAEQKAMDEARSLLAITRKMTECKD